MHNYAVFVLQNYNYVVFVFYIDSVRSQGEGVSSGLSFVRIVSNG